MYLELVVVGKLVYYPFVVVAWLDVGCLTPVGLVLLSVVAQALLY
jgi:hypothetical protein